MRALLLAAGFGTRLRPLTDSVPKCLVPIKGEPLLGIWIDRLSAAGVRAFLVNTHYLPDQVRAFIASRPDRHAILQAHEEVLLNTAGTLRANLGFFQGEDGMLIHADNYCLADFKAFQQAHRERPAHCLMTMMTFRTETPQSCGIVELDEEGVVQAFHEKKANPPGNLANGAVYLLSAELLAMMEKEFAQATDFSNEVLPHLVGRIATYETPEFFLDIGTPQAYERANRS
ncbi:nucleotidyltransferase family protein [Massilia endophytica]|uniref:nucleotidyltransferase family protein n=1 Tax=Massilia endophytica TaxID=2899220 RepID=UPI001E379CCF|nr:nucleotidyltransferase family protein [Massilia endophytica]UGQ46603.1 nucleotidyltransferase family protein [Massilia endophytica]